MIDDRLLCAPDGALRRTLPAADGTGATFSSRQATAIGRRGETLVSAGAGAGKTSVLVERYLRLLLEDDTRSTQSILAITFTEKAAAEMRERVRLRLTELAGTGVALPERWRLDDAWIGTFHGVAQRLLRRYALAAGIDPDAQVADERRANELRHLAFDRALARWLDQDGALDLAAGARIEGLREDTLGLLALRRSQGHDPAEDPDRPALPVPQPATAHRRRCAEALLAASGPAVAASRRTSEEFPTGANQRALDQIVSIVAQIEGTLDGADPALPALEVVRAWKAPTRSTKVGKTEEVEGLRAATEAAVVAARAAELEPYGAQEIGLRTALLSATAGIYARLKQEQATVDFDDLLLALLGLLRRRPDIAARLRARFREVLVDEYQDTNPVQLQVIHLLSEPAGRFQVGDRLQAIYGFRHATVAGFDEAAQRAHDVGGRLELDETFRCPVPVLALTNRIGTAAHTGYQPLVGGHENAPKDTRGAPAVELHLLADGAPEPPNGNGNGDEEEEDPVGAGEPEYVAGLVAELVAAGQRPRDIALLVRRKAPVAGLERALMDRGIDAVPVVAASLLDTLEVHELEAWLRAVANPQDDVALLGALRLPSAGIDADALVPLVAEHRAARERSREAGEPTPALWDTLRSIDDARATVPISEDARDQIEHQTTVLLRHRGLSRRAGPAAILERVRADDGYRASILARPGGARRWAGVEAFVDWAEQQEVAGDDLTAFLDRIVEDRAAGADGLSAPVLTDGDAIRITTIHRAKGLEWPVVIGCDLGAKVMATRAGVLVDADPASDRIGLRLKAANDTVELWDYPDLRAAADRAQAQEERRLIHVLMTRAKQRLILSGTWPAERDDAGKERGPTGRLDPTKGCPLDGPKGHDHAPRTPPLRWLLPLLVPAESWPAVGEEATVTVTDPTGATARPADVRLVAADPAARRSRVAAPSPGPSVVESDATIAKAGVQTALRLDEGRAIVASRLVDGAAVSATGERRPADPPDRVRPGTVSFSALAERLALETDAVNAPRDAAWLRAEGDPVPDDGLALDAAVPALAADERGTLVHALLERRLDGSRPEAARGPATPADLGDVAADVLPDRADLDLDALAPELLSLVARLEATPLATQALTLPPTRRHVERPLLLDPGDGLPLVQGVIDLWLTGEDGAVTIGDWKTNRLRDHTPEQIVAGHYALQRDIYALAALLGGAPTVTVTFVFAEAPDAPVSAAFTPVDVAELRDRVAAEIDRAYTSGG